MPADSSREPPRRICVLRLSALGDVCHVLPVVRTLQDAWPGAEITWILGKLEHKLLGHLPGIEFVVFDKQAGRAAYAGLRRQMAGRRFDVLLHMQLAIRASVAAAVIPARVELGFDRARAREAQWLFTTHRIAPRRREHVLDSFFGFAEALGLGERVMRWDIPLPDSLGTPAACLRQPAIHEQREHGPQGEGQSLPREGRLRVNRLGGATFRRRSAAG